MDSSGTPSIEEAHAQALKELTKARRFAVVTPLVLLIILILGIWWKFDHFARTDGHKLPATFLKKAPQTLAPLARQAGGSIERLTPVFRDAFVAVYERDKGLYRRLFQNQIGQFLEYSHSLGGTMKGNFEGMSDQVLASLEDRLTPGMSVEERIEFRGHAALRLYTLLEEEIENKWQDHIHQIELTTKQLYSISLTAPTEKQDPKKMIGTALELYGLYLQEKELN